MKSGGLFAPPITHQPITRALPTCDVRPVGFGVWKMNAWEAQLFVQAGFHGYGFFAGVCATLALLGVALHDKQIDRTIDRVVLAPWPPDCHQTTEAVQPPYL